MISTSEQQIFFFCKEKKSLNKQRNLLTQIQSFFHCEDIVLFHLKIRIILYFGQNGTVSLAIPAISEITDTIEQ